MSLGNNPPRHLAVGISRYPWYSSSEGPMGLEAGRKEPLGSCLHQASLDSLKKGLEPGTKTIHILLLSLPLFPWVFISVSDSLGSICLFHYLFYPSLQFKILGRGASWVGQMPNWLSFCMMPPLPPISDPLHWSQMGRLVE